MITSVGVPGMCIVESIATPQHMAFLCEVSVGSVASFFFSPSSFSDLLNRRKVQAFKATKQKRENQIACPACYLVNVSPFISFYTGPSASCHGENLFITAVRELIGSARRKTLLGRGPFACVLVFTGFRKLLEIFGSFFSFFLGLDYIVVSHYLRKKSGQFG
jgi:hypothetical protein